MKSSLDLVVKDNVMGGAPTVGLGLPVRYRVPVRRPHRAVVGLIRGGKAVRRVALDPLAYGATGFNPFLGSAHHPRLDGRLAGGSSGHVAAAVVRGGSASRATLGIGSDTGGSVRIPAAFCQLFGLKLTVGLLPGAVFPLAPGLDAVGLLADRVSILTTGLLRLGLTDDHPMPAALGLEHLNLMALDGATIAEFAIESDASGGYRAAVEAIARLTRVSMFTETGSATAWTCRFDAYFVRGVKSRAAAPLQALLRRLDEAVIASVPSLGRLRQLLDERVADCEHGGRCARSIERVWHRIRTANAILLLPATGCAAPPSIKDDGRTSRAEMRAISHLSLFANVTGCPAVVFPSRFGPLQLVGPPRSEHHLVRSAELLQRVLEKGAGSDRSVFETHRLSEVQRSDGEGHCADREATAWG